MPPADIERVSHALSLNQRVVFDALEEGVFLLDHENRVLFHNNAAREILPDISVGLLLSESCPCFYQAFFAQIEAALAAKQAEIGPIPFKRQSDELHVKLRCSQLPLGSDVNAGQPVLMVAISNVTKMVQALATIEEAYAALDHQLVTARRYQDALFTHRLDARELSCEAIGMPAYELSGDFFNVGRVGERFLIIMGDVQSHGIEVAIKAITLQHLCRQNIGQVPQTAELMASLNRFVLNDAHDSFWSCCIFVASYDPLSRSLYYSRAGMPEPVLVRSDGGVEYVTLGDSPLGYFEEENYSSGLCFIKPGDRLLLASDGVTECRIAGAKADFYGHANLVANYLEQLQLDPGHSLRELARSIVRQHGSAIFTDDFTLAEIIFK
jgi:serine phosphatase RsbU (regulator of sigma subunit)